MNIKLFLPILLLGLFVLLFNLTAHSIAKHQLPNHNVLKFNRHQLMVVNLNQGHDSTGFHITQSWHQTRQTLKGIDKALRQLEQVDQQYAKSKGRPDDHFLEIPAEKIRAAQRTAQQLQNELKEAKEELKSSIQQVLITD